jgi:glycosyltransferase involved in cell wall biosynthesis
MRITYLTAGAAGMYCGSCMHDNTLARALVRLGVDVQLVPLYTPILVDEVDVSQEEVFFGGINVYLQQRFRLFRYLPRMFDRILDRPGLLRWIGSRGIETKAAQLGELAVSMLKGAAGFQRKEVQRLCQWLEQHPRPHLINLTNMLIAGAAPELRRTLQTPITVTLQGDDIFLEQLTAKHRAQALGEISRLADSIDAFLVHSDYYADYMSEYLSLPRTKFRRVPLGIDTDGFTKRDYPEGAEQDAQRPLQIGYLARLAPEKGLHVLVDAFLLLHQMPGQLPPVQLRIAGWLGKQHEAYARMQFAKLDQAGLGDCYEYLGSVDRQEKQEMLHQLDIFSVPAVYRDPKGLYVLEALAAGAPVVLPRHGAFPELVEATGGGILVPPEDRQALASALHQLLVDTTERRRLSASGQSCLLEKYHAEAMALTTRDVFQQVIADAQDAGATMGHA